MIHKLKRALFPLEESAYAELLEDFHKIYLEHRDFIRSSIYWMVRSEVVDDLVQETFLKAWRGFEHFDKNSSVRTWLYRIGMNTTYDYLRKVNREQKIEPNEEEDNSSIEIDDLITKGVKQLSEKQREVFILFYRLEYTQKEIAYLINAPEGTVKSRIFHAKEKFVKFLKKNGVEGG